MFTEGHELESTCRKEYVSYVFIISQLWLTSHRRSKVVLLESGTSGTSTEIYNDNVNDGTRTCNPLVIKPNALAIELTAQKLLLGRSGVAV